MSSFHLLQGVALAAVLVLFPVVVAAGGPFEPPDGVGNPSGADYTGFSVYGWVIGAHHSNDVKTTISCMNLGSLPADAIAVQFYNNLPDPSRSPDADVAIGRLEPSEVDELRSIVVHGAMPVISIARILVRDSFPRLAAAIHCDVLVQGRVTEEVLLTLDVIKPPPPKKKKKRRRR